MKLTTIGLTITILQHFNIPILSKYKWMLAALPFAFFAYYNLKHKKYSLSFFLS